MQQPEQLLQQLVGLPLAIARNAGGMKVFHFGKIAPHRRGEGTVGEWALHAQCPWHISGPDGVIVGPSDRYINSSGDSVDPTANSYNPKDGSLESIRLLGLLGGFDDETGSHVSLNGTFVVQTASLDRVGGLQIDLQGGVTLRFFIDSSIEECWRFFEPDGSWHLVCVGGRIEYG